LNAELTVWRSPYERDNWRDKRKYPRPAWFNRIVSAEWIAAMAGILGAIAGAGGTLTANWISSRTQVKLSDCDRKQREAETRRDAYAKYLIYGSCRS
jgi:hypothetical protein